LPASSDRPRKKRRRPVLPRERKPRTLLEYFALMGTTSKYAIAGITHTFRTQRNMRNHCIACIGAVLLGLLTGLSPLEWVAIVLAIGLVIAAELMNTAVEATVDLVTEEWHDLAPDRQGRSRRRRAPFRNRRGDHRVARLPAEVARVSRCKHPAPGAPNDRSPPPNLAHQR
jgi:diacylglycerol kinase